MPRTAATGHPHTYVPDAEQGAAIADFVRVLDQAGLDPSQARPALVAANGERLEIPESMYDVLHRVAEALATGMGVSISPHNALLTTQEAADYLGISRPTLVRILERGEIPMERPGRHRFVRLQDLVAYQDQTRTRRRQSLDDLVADAETDHLYDQHDRPAPKTR